MTWRYFTGLLASTLLELSGHVFVTLTTIFQSLFFYTKLEKMFMYITKSMTDAFPSILCGQVLWYLLTSKLFRISQ